MRSRGTIIGMVGGKRGRISFRSAIRGEIQGMGMIGGEIGGSRGMSGTTRAAVVVN